MEILKVLNTVQLKDWQRGQSLNKESRKEFLNTCLFLHGKMSNGVLKKFIMRQAVRASTGSGTLPATSKEAG